MHCCPCWSRSEKGLRRAPAEHRAARAFGQFLTRHARALTRVSINSARVRILIADDDRDTVLSLSAILRDEGYETIGVYNGADALAALDEFEPEVVILDIAMPGMNGWDVARQIRNTRGSKAPLLIAISGQYTKSVDRLISDIAGFNHYYVKPCDPNALLPVLTRLRSAS
jgi:two-component system CheB/CheR fusion protein